MPDRIPPTAALLWGPDAHYLDHLAPICDLMDIPLLVTDPDIHAQAKKYYPFLETKCFPYLEMSQTLIEHYDIIFTCMPRVLFDEIFFFTQKLRQKKVHTIWVPHGNSDKGHASIFMEGLKDEEVALLYGDKMKDFLQQKGAFHQLKAWVQIGNLRQALYKRHKAFYTTLVQREITTKLQPNKKNILYAPTWQDAERSCSLFDALPHLTKHLPKEYNLLIKPHPNFYLSEERDIEERYESHPQIHFIKDFPAIYPLLDYVDIYLGDMSSIGYDFLTYNKPMFFLNQNDRDQSQDLGLYLFRCGVAINHKDYPRIYEIIAQELALDGVFEEIRKEVYHYTFGKERKREELKKEIEKAYHAFPDKDLNFY